MITTVLFDFGGVLAEEGFHEGLLAIGRNNAIDPHEFFKTADTLIYETGYLTGGSDEASFWNAVRRQTGIAGDDASLRREILSRFLLRPDVLAQADLLRARGLTVAILSDQTNWLDEIDAETALFSRFDRVFNSFRMHKSKRDAAVFIDVCVALGSRPAETLFIDDNSDHIGRAQSRGLQTIHFTNSGDFETALKARLASLERGPV